jgi:Tetracyclin repressor-like, C-terminal domain
VFLGHRAGGGACPGPGGVPRLGVRAEDGRPRGTATGGTRCSPRSRSGPPGCSASGSARWRPPGQRLAAAAAAYVRFADERRALFQALAGSGLDKDPHPEIARAAQPIGALFFSAAAELAGGDQAAAARLVSAIVATARGHAALMLDGTFGSGPGAAEAAAGHAAAAALALIEGGQALAGEPARP